MTEASPAPQLLGLLLLRRTRAVVRTPRGRALVVGIATAYALLAMIAGYMLELARTGATGTSVRVLTNPYSPAWWNYPALLVIAPGGVVVLPFFATVSMVVVAVGVGVGMSAGLLLAVRFFRSWKTAQGGSSTAASLAGMTPPIVALLTLGACCSTSAAAAGGIGAVAMVSGTSYNQILLNPWILNVFQIVVLGIALLAQELLIGIYAGLFETASPAGPTATCAPRPDPAGTGEGPSRARGPRPGPVGRKAP